MVRFIMLGEKIILRRVIYLHSNMVRFIIGVGDMFGKGTAVFTFQYG